jgi:hypothetical protein
MHKLASVLEGLGTGDTAAVKKHLDAKGLSYDFIPWGSGARPEA